MEHISVTYQHIAAILSFEVPNSTLEPILLDSNFNWDSMVIEGSRHLVLPAIYCRLKSKQLLHVLPTELKDYLEQFTAINRNRNTSLIKQVTSISELLNQHQIEHVFLKGSAMLVLECFEDQAERMVGDIDILVSQSQINSAFELLKRNGYDKTFGFTYEDQNFRHLDRLISDEALAAIELHSDLIVKPYQHLINIDDVLHSKVKVNHIAIPNTYYLSLHHILACQYNDLGFFYQRIHLKYLYDSVILNVHNNSVLLLHLLKHRYGQAYLALANCYFKEFDEISSTKRMRSYVNSHERYLSRPGYRKLKNAYMFIKKRLTLAFSNSSYRYHILKKIFLKKK
jgi:hypothetical protein